MLSKYCATGKILTLVAVKEAIILIFLIFSLWENSRKYIPNACIWIWHANYTARENEKGFEIAVWFQDLIVQTFEQGIISCYFLHLFIWSTFRHTSCLVLKKGYGSESLVFHCFSQIVLWCPHISISFGLSRPLLNWYLLKCKAEIHLQ